MINLKYINISIICIFFVSIIFYFAFIKNSTYETIDNIEYNQIEMIDSKECNTTNTYFRYHLIFSENGHLASDYVWQADNIPCDTINAKKCVLVKYSRTKHKLCFNPLSIKFNLVSKQEYDTKKDKKIVYKKEIR